MGGGCYNSFANNKPIRLILFKWLSCRAYYLERRQEGMGRRRVQLEQILLAKLLLY